MTSVTIPDRPFSRKLFLWRRTVFFIGVVLLSFSCQRHIPDAWTVKEVRPWKKKARPVDRKATHEARALLAYLYSISGKQTLAGQHNQPFAVSAWSEMAHKLSGAYPAVWGQDFGFDAPKASYGVNFRDTVIHEAMRHYGEGTVITLSWHAVCPLKEEPAPFNGGVKRTVSDEDWEAILTPGTELHDRWLRQVDVIAGLLSRLQEARVPVLWRPYHEMNRQWFWWGGRPEGFAQLWKNLYNRLVVHHELHNLIWVWSPHAEGPGILDYEPFFPGPAYVDVLALDDYDGDYNLRQYEKLLALAGAKPIGLGAVGVMPTVEVLEEQPRWAWFLTWGDALTNKQPNKTVQEIFQSDRVITLPAGEQK